MALAVVSRELTVKLKLRSELAIHASGQSEEICHIVWLCSIFPSCFLFIIPSRALSSPTVLYLLSPAVLYFPQPCYIFLSRALLIIPSCALFSPTVLYFPQPCSTYYPQPCSIFPNCALFMNQFPHTSTKLYKFLIVLSLL